MAGIMHDQALQGLLQHAGVWRGKQRRHELPVVASGHRELDRHLPGCGWPCGSLTELMAARPGLGEFSLLLPALAAVSAHSWVLLVDPPWTPYPPALQGHGINLQRLLLVRTQTAAESLWACEQALAGLHNGAVLSWLQGGRHAAGFKHLRRLQLAARHGRKLAFAFRPPAAAGSASPAALRLYLEAAGPEQLQLSLLKCRGARHGKQLRLARSRVTTRSATPATTPMSSAHPTGAGRLITGQAMAGQHCAASTS